VAAGWGRERRATSDERDRPKVRVFVRVSGLPIGLAHRWTPGLPVARRQRKAENMRSLTELPPDALKVAHDAAEALIYKKAFLPPGGLLVMLLGRFRDDIREVLGNGIDATGELPRRGREHRSLDELTSVELDTVAGAVAILLQDRFAKSMDDPALPKLLDEFRDKLTDQKTERAQIRAEMAS
jgi:hypothetical protein